MKKIKKVIVSLLALLLVANAGSALASCKKNKNSSVSTTSESTEAEISDSVSDGSGSSDTDSTESHTHEYGEWVVIKEADCTEAGERQRACVAGDDTQTETIPALEHDYVDGVCSRCGAIDPDYVPPVSQGLDYTLSEDGTYYTVSGIGACTDENIIIPEKEREIPVTAIAENAFSGCTAITGIIIPESITSIGSGAFRNCTALTEINFNATACEDFGSNNGVFYKAGQSGEGIKVTVGSNVKRLPSYLFYPDGASYVPKIVSVEFSEDSVCESIGSSVFVSGSSLTSITIPESITSIGTYAFSGCKALTEINFNATACEDFTSENGIFYQAGQSGAGIKVKVGANVTKIPDYLFCPTGGISTYAPKIVSVEFSADGVCESIGAHAFDYCVNLTSISLPDSVTLIDAYAFRNCTAITSVTLSGNLISIGTYAFQKCSRISSITIPESVVSIAAYAFDGCSGLLNATFKDKNGWWVSTSGTATSGTEISLELTSVAATYLRQTYKSYYWTRSE